MSNPDRRGMPTPRTITRTLFQLSQEIDNPNVNDETRGRIAGEVVKKHQEMQRGEMMLEMLRHGMDTRDKAELRYAINQIQRDVHHGSKQDIQQITDSDLDELLAGKSVMIGVATQTHGERIVFFPDHIFMANDDKYGHQQRNNFAHLFGLNPDDKDGEKLVNF